jgi:hypothetical protein
VEGAASPLRELTAREREVLGHVAEGKNNAAIARTLVQRRYRELARQILDLGLISQGSVVLRHTHCGAPGCRCHANPPQLHGPYWQWTRRDSGRTITRRLTEPQARLYQEWIANRRRLAEIISEMEQVCEQAAEVLLQQADSSTPDQPVDRTTRRSSRARA